MDVGFEDASLALVETDRAAETKLPIAVIQAARSCLNILRAAPDERTLRNWKSLGYQRLEESAGITGCVSLAGNWRLWLRLDASGVPNKLTIVEASQAN